MTGYFAAIGSAVLYGLIPLLSKGIFAEGGTAISVVAFRFLVALPFIFLTAVFKRISLRITKSELVKLLDCL